MLNERRAVNAAAVAVVVLFDLSALLGMDEDDEAGCIVFGEGFGGASILDDNNDLVSMVFVLTILADFAAALVVDCNSFSS